MFPWYKNLSPDERRTFWACYGGWSLDALDAQIFSLVLGAIIGSWGISKTAAGSIASVSLVASALGGWVFGALTDRYGRVRMLQVTILCFSVFTFLSAFAQNLPQLLALKGLQGFGFGGEWAVGSVLIAETVPSKYRGQVMGTVQSGWAVGWGLSVLLYGFVFSFAAPELGWRIMFALGLLPALLVIFVQRSLKEPVRALGSRTPSRVSGLPFLEIFSRQSLRITLICSLLGVGAHGGYYALTTWLPTFLKSERGISVLGASGYLAVIITAFWCGCVACSYFLDKLGRRQTILFFSVGCVATVFVDLLLPITNMQMLFVGFPLGFFSAGIPASMGPLFSELFPAGIRGTGVGFCYNMGRIVSAAFPFLVGKLSVTRGLGFAIGIDAAFAYSLVVIAAILLPETRNKVLVNS